LQVKPGLCFLLRERNAAVVATAVIGDTDTGRAVAGAALRAAGLLGLTAAELALVLGLSPATVSRLRQNAGATRLTGKPYELALMFIRLYRSLDAITGGDDAVSRQWMRNPNQALGQPPAERIRTVEGLAHVVAYLDARRAPL
jgi:transcriptional regulator with XRE-family HTH domain